MTIAQLQAAYQRAIKRAEAAKAHAERITLARTAAAPGVTFEDVGRAHCDLLLCQTEMQDAKDDLYAELRRRDAAATA